MYYRGDEILGELFTIGHSQHNINYFIGLLKEYSIDYLLDVRSTPYSKYAEQYNKDNISKELDLANIRYNFMGKYFGARPQNLDLYNNEGYLDFEKVKKSPNFNKGIENVIVNTVVILLDSYKKQQMSWDDYVVQYNLLIEKHNVEKIFLKKYTEFDKILLLCSEVTAENCHRRLLAERFKKYITNTDIIHL